MPVKLQRQWVVWASTLPLALAAAIGLCDGPRPEGANAQAPAAAAAAEADAGPTSLASGGVFGAAAFSPDGRRLLTRSSISQLQLWDIPAGAVVRRFFDHPLSDGAAQLAWSANGALIAAGCVRLESPGLYPTGAYVAVWNAASGTEVQRRELTAPGSATASNIVHVQLAPDGKRVFAIVEVGGKWSARVWDVASGKELVKIDGLSGANGCAQMSADGRRVFCDNSVARVAASVVWDAVAGNEVCRFNPSGKGILTCSAISPDGTRIATAAYRAGNLVKIWDAATGRELRALKGHTDELASVAFTPDGRRVITGSADNTARFWNPDTGEELKQLKRPGRVHSAAPDADGRRVDAQWWVRGEAQPRHSIWTPETGNVDDLPDGAEVLGFGPDSHWYLVVERGLPAKEWPHRRGSGVATLHDARTGNAIRTYR